MKFGNFLFPASMDPSRYDYQGYGIDEATVSRNVADTWIWRNVFVAETDAEAQRLARPAFETQAEFQAMRRRIYEEQGVLLKPELTPATVTEAITAIDWIGVGGLILVFRIGPMPCELAERSIRLFMDKVAPEFPD